MLATKSNVYTFQNNGTWPEQWNLARTMEPCISPAGFPLIYDGIRRRAELPIRYEQNPSGLLV